jgi:hypothetical protein
MGKKKRADENHWWKSIRWLTLIASIIGVIYVTVTYLVNQHIKLERLGDKGKTAESAINKSQYTPLKSSLHKAKSKVQD